MCSKHCYACSFFLLKPDTCIRVNEIKTHFHTCVNCIENKNEKNSLQKACLIEPHPTSLTIKDIHSFISAPNAMPRSSELPMAFKDILMLILDK